MLNALLKADELIVFFDNISDIMVWNYSSSYQSGKSNWSISIPAHTSRASATSSCVKVGRNEGEKIVKELTQKHENSSKKQINLKK